MTASVAISDLPNHVGETVTLKGWLYHWRKGGKIWFLVLRDGSGYVQGVVSKADVSEAVWDAATRATQESTLEVTGVVRADPRSPGGVELGVTDVKILDLCHDWPITPKEHGVDFLLSQRHLWLRSSKQVAILKVRSEVESAIHDFFYARGYTRVDSPILTPSACEGTSTLFETAVHRGGEGLPLAVAASSTSSRRRRRSERSTASARPSAPRSRRRGGTCASSGWWSRRSPSSRSTG